VQVTAWVAGGGAGWHAGQPQAGADEQYHAQHGPPGNRRPAGLPRQQGALDATPVRGQPEAIGKIALQGIDHTRLQQCDRSIQLCDGQPPPAPARNTDAQGQVADQQREKVKQM